MTSLISSFVLHAHKRCTGQLGHTHNEDTAVSASAAGVWVSGAGLYKMTTVGRSTVLLGLFSSLGLAITVMNVALFRTRVAGFLYWVTGTSFAKTVTWVSAYTLLPSLQGATTTTTFVIMAVDLLLVFVVPFVHFVVLIILWAKPSSPRMQAT